MRSFVLALVSSFVLSLFSYLWFYFAHSLFSSFVRCFGSDFVRSLFHYFYSFARYLCR